MWGYIMGFKGEKTTTIKCRLSRTEEVGNVMGTNSNTRADVINSVG